MLIKSAGNTLHLRCKAQPVIAVLADYYENQTEHTNTLRVMYKNSVRTSQETSPLQSPTGCCCLGKQPLWFCKNHTEHTNITPII
jgi:hypothetical protein